ncbi:hypothetical protein ACSVH5_02305 [Flavobacterium sp. RSSA_27]|uniref:hypothetical protein n=1 Tax=Flavobacterium sp. RSSA_27 TaxID=3447667 RepID=UPI003F38F613
MIIFQNKYASYAAILFKKKIGTLGIDPNKKDYIIGSIPEKRFSGKQVLAYYYTSWRLAIPQHVAELGLDYGKEFELALKIKN